MSIKKFLMMFACVTMAASAMTRSPEIKNGPNAAEGWDTLPREIKVSVLSAINTGSLDGTIKQLAKLREVNSEFKEYIDNPSTGKMIFQSVANKYSKDQRALIGAAIDLNTQGSIVWLQSDPERISYAARLLFDPAQQKRAQKIIAIVGPNYVLKETPIGPMPLLQYAIWWVKEGLTKQEGLIAKLLEAKADINMVNNEVTALDIALSGLQQQQRLKVESSAMQRIVALLKKHGAKTYQELQQEKQQGLR